MCLYIRPLTTEETDQVATWATSYDAVTARRARIIQLSALGEKVPAIADTIGCSTRWVRETIHRVTRDGLARIPRRKSPGRPRRCTVAQRDALIEVLHQRPDTYGHAASQWTAADLAATAMRLGIVNTISEDTVRVEIKPAHRFHFSFLPPQEREYGRLSPLRPTGDKVSGWFVQQSHTAPGNPDLGAIDRHRIGVRIYRYPYRADNFAIDPHAA